MFLLDLVNADVVTSVSAALPSNIVDIQPDMDAPGSAGLKKIGSWVLGLCTIFAFIALVVCAVLILSKGFGNSALQKMGASSIIWALIGTVSLGSISSIFALVIGFDLGL